MVLHENLLTAFHTGEFVSGTRSLKLGTARGKAQTTEADRHEFDDASGVLSRPDGEPPYAWLVGLRPAIDLDVLQPLDRELELQIASAVSGSQRVVIRFNGHELGTHVLPADGSAVSLDMTVVADLQRRGSNRLEFAFDAVESRRLADELVALPLAGVITTLRFAPQGEEVLAVPPSRRFGLSPARGEAEGQNVLFVPPGMSARVSVDVPSTHRVALAFTLRSLSVPLEVSVLPDSGKRTLLRTFQPTEEMPRDARFDLTPWAGQALVIEFWSRAGEGEGARIGPAHVQVPEGALLAGAEQADPGVVVPEQAPSFLVVTLDALARRQLIRRGDELSFTPVLDALIASGISFPDATSPASYTLASIGSLLTGQDPLTHGVWAVEDGLGVQRLAADAPRLASTLLRAGWRTAAFVTNPNAAARHGFGEGFEVYDELHADPSLWEPGVAGEHLPPRLAAWLDEVAGQPFFSYVHVFEPHAPYDAPADLLARHVKPYHGPVRGDRAWIDAFRTGEVGADLDGLRHLRDLYVARVALADRVLGELLDVLRRADRAEDTVVVVLSDHGEAFGEHGLIEHGDHVYGEQVEIPLVFVVPGREADRRRGPATLADVAPTLLGLAGQPRAEGMLGVDLFTADAGEPRALIARSSARLPALSWTRWPMRLVVDLGTRSTELYDLLRDPAERSNLIAARSATAALMYRELTEAVCAAESGSREREPGESIDDGLLNEQLGAIGYLGTAGASPEGVSLCGLLRQALRRP
jgi:arylsulfatase A-like enzyme